jgi:hypothetical protein
MLSWVFRHLARLQVIYGRVEGPELAGERFRISGQPTPLAAAGPESARPGEVRLRARGQVEIRPMPRRVA